jgi:CRP/FNR family transcriptional regulator, cyclic AMP receptor protein
MDLSFLQKLPVMCVPAGHLLIEEGKPVPGLYFLESGEVEVLKGGTLVAEIYDAGAVFGDMSYLLQTVPTATVRTLTSSQFRQVANPAEFFRLNPEVALHVAQILARRLDSLTRYLVDIKHQFKDRADHLAIIDQVLDALMHKHPRNLPRRASED